MPVDSITSVIICFACFGLLPYIALMRPKNVQWNQFVGDAGTKVKLWLQSIDNDVVCKYDVITVACVGGIGYLCWSGHAPYSPPSLSATEIGRLTVGCWAMFYLHILSQFTLNTRLYPMQPGPKVKRAVVIWAFISTLSWISFLVIGILVGTLWGYTWTLASRGVALGLWIFYYVGGVPVEMLVLVRWRAAALSNQSITHSLSNLSSIVDTRSTTSNVGVPTREERGVGSYQF